MPREYLIAWRVAIVRGLKNESEAVYISETKARKIRDNPQNIQTPTFIFQAGRQPVAIKGENVSSDSDCDRAPRHCEIFGGVPSGSSPLGGKQPHVALVPERVKVKSYRGSFDGDSAYHRPPPAHAPSRSCPPFEVEVLCITGHHSFCGLARGSCHRPCPRCPAWNSRFRHQK